MVIPWEGTGLGAREGVELIIMGGVNLREREALRIISLTQSHRDY